MEHFQTVHQLSKSEIMNEINFWANRPFSHAMPEPKRHKTKPIKSGIEKTERKERKRTSFSYIQLQGLEETYSKNKYISVEQRRGLSRLLKLGDESIKYWFQNKRMKEKRKLSKSHVTDSDSSESIDCMSDSATAASEKPAELKSSEETRNVELEHVIWKLYQNQEPHIDSSTENLSTKKHIPYENPTYFTDLQNCTQFYRGFNGYSNQYYPYLHNYDYQPQGCSMLTNYCNTDYYAPNFYYHEL